MKEKKLTLKEKLIMSLKILAGLLFISMTISMFFGFDTEIVGGNIAVIPIHGVITVEENAGFGSDVSASDNVIESLKKADENPNIKAILLDINSPGGSPVATDEISQKIKSINRLRQNIGFGKTRTTMKMTKYSRKNTAVFMKPESEGCFLKTIVSGIFGQQKIQDWKRTAGCGP